jgi:NAD(P)-dependent dehydrogenase (short-subunit alcohol dehydrogenase family)
VDTSKAVLVTGCSSGIGKATALTLVKAGLPTWASARNLESISDLASAGCRVVQLDVTDEESRVRAVKAVEAEHGAVGALVNNAGYGQTGPVEEVTLEMYQRQFDTNVFGLIRMCQLVLPNMRAQGYGTIVNVGSAAGLVTPPTSSAYSMTKYSLEALVDAMRIEVGVFGVRVVLLEPGAVRSRFMETGNATTPRSVPGPYDAFKDNVEKMAERAHRPGVRAVKDSDDVAKVALKAITARRPKARYKIGSQARVAPLVRRLVGDRTWDRMMLRMAPNPGN